MTMHRNARLAGLPARTLGLLLILCCAALRSSFAAGVRDLRCEYLANPLGIHEAAPRLSWRMDSTRRGEMQIAYQVLAASAPELLARQKGDLWDSGRVASDQSAHVAYAGV